MPNETSSGVPPSGIPFNSDSSTSETSGSSKSARSVPSSSPSASYGDSPPSLIPSPSSSSSSFSSSSESNSSSSFSDSSSSTSSLDSSSSDSSSSESSSSFSSSSESSQSESSSSSSSSSQSSSSNSSASSSSNSSCGCKLLRNNAEITDSNRNLLPGEKNVLDISCPSGTITNVIWDIPGVTFLDWVADIDNGVFTALPASALAATPITFYWTDAADNRVVKVKFKLDGKDCSVSATLNVKSLTVTFVADTPPIGSVQLYPNATNPISIGLLNAPGGTPAVGIRLGAGVDQTFGTMGQFQFIQTIYQPDRRWKLAGTPPTCMGVLQNPPGTKSVFDKNIYPFDGPFDVNPPGPSPTQDGLYTAINNATMIQVSNRDRSYQTWVMFKSGLAHAKWVPPYYTIWGWTGCCDRQNTGAAWNLVDARQNVSPWVVSTIHPEWAGKIGDFLAPSPVTCPPTCIAPGP